RTTHPTPPLKTVDTNLQSRRVAPPPKDHCFFVNALPWGPGYGLVRRLPACCRHFQGCQPKHDNDPIPDAESALRTRKGRGGPLCEDPRQAWLAASPSFRVNAH